MLPSGCDITNLFTLLLNEYNKLEPNHSVQNKTSPTKETSSPARLNLTASQGGMCF